MEINVKCPHCDGSIVVLSNEINCGIFRHGIIKTTNMQMNPHETKEICDRLFTNGEIYGCGKPFRLGLFGSTYTAESCDYI